MSVPIATAAVDMTRKKTDAAAAAPATKRSVVTKKARTHRTTSKIGRVPTTAAKPALASAPAAAATKRGDSTRNISRTHIDVFRCNGRKMDDHLEGAHSTHAEIDYPLTADKSTPTSIDGPEAVVETYHKKTNLLTKQTTNV